MSGSVRALATYTEAGVANDNASCGRLSWKHRRNSSKRSCCSRRVNAGGFAVSCFSVRCIRSCYLRLRFCACTKPARRKIALTVLADGQFVSPLVCSSRARSLRAPHPRGAYRSSTIRFTIGSAVTCAQLFGHLPRSSSPRGPASSKRSIHLQPVSRYLVHLTQSSLLFRSPLSTSAMI